MSIYRHMYKYVFKGATKYTYTATDTYWDKHESNYVYTYCHRCVHIHVWISTDVVEQSKALNRQQRQQETTTTTTKTTTPTTTTTRNEAFNKKMNIK